MLQAVGSPSTSGLLRSVTSNAGQSSELAKLEKERAACINCDTANTREGQAKIEALSQKISQVQQRISEADALKETHQSSTAKQLEANTPQALTEPQANDVYRSNQPSPFGNGTSALGYAINTQA